MLPWAMRPLSSNIPVKVFVKTDLPEPDSPTKARTSPSISSKETPRIAVRTLSRTSNSTTISRAVKITLLSFCHVYSYLCVRGSLASAKFWPTTNRDRGYQNQGCQRNPEQVSVGRNVLWVIWDQTSQTWHCYRQSNPKKERKAS